MKTVYELECWLKKGDHSLRIEMDKDKFLVSILSGSTVVASGLSKTLDAAIENAMMELRQGKPKASAGKWINASVSIPPAQYTSPVSARMPVNGAVQKYDWRRDPVPGNALRNPANPYQLGDRVDDAGEIFEFVGWGNGMSGGNWKKVS